LEIVKILIEHKADINCKNVLTQDTPLHISVALNRIDITKLLLANGADVNYKNVAGMASLYLANKQNYTTMVKLLLGHGANKCDVELPALKQC